MVNVYLLNTTLKDFEPLKKGLQESEKRIRSLAGRKKAARVSSRLRRHSIGDMSILQTAGETGSSSLPMSYALLIVS